MPLPRGKDGIGCHPLLQLDDPFQGADDRVTAFSARDLAVECWYLGPTISATLRSDTQTIGLHVQRAPRRRAVMLPCHLVLDEQPPVTTHAAAP
jgi:hypothetical protein